MFKMESMNNNRLIIGEPGAGRYRVIQNKIDNFIEL